MSSVNDRVAKTLMRINAFRRRKPKKTLKDIALVMNTTQQSVSRILIGKQSFTVRALFMIADILDVSISALIEGRGSEEDESCMRTQMRQEIIADVKGRILMALDEH